MTNRPPIIVIMGHVDHGKTTLLDYIRKTRVAEREAGGITQAIGAYEIEYSGKKMTFIDTPGHEAFSNMRLHGARIADIAILIVSAEDGVKPQTKDALSCIKAEKIPYIVAINKIDSSKADIDKTKNDLSQAEVYLEGFGGDISWQAISAKTGKGVSELLDLILLTSELENLKETSEISNGVIISVGKDPRRGIVVGGILTGGRIETGQKIVTQSVNGKIRILENFLGKQEKQIKPSSPFVVIGFDGLPKIGEVFYSDNDKDKIEKLIKNEIVSNLKKQDNSKRQETKQDNESINVVLKAGESASLEALEGLIKKLSKEIPFVIVNSSVGNIHEGDIKNAENTDAILVGFGSKVDKAAENVIREKKIYTILSSIIYELEKSIITYVSKTIKKEVNSIEILGIFGDQKSKQKIIGGRVIHGPIKNQSEFEIWQDKKMIGTGKILNLQSGKQDIQIAEDEKEVGLYVETSEQIKIGNILIFEI